MGHVLVVPSRCGDRSAQRQRLLAGTSASAQGLGYREHAQTAKGILEFGLKRRLSQRAVIARFLDPAY